MIYFVTDRKGLNEKVWLECMIRRMEEGVDCIIVRDKGYFDVQLVRQLMKYKKAHADVKTKILIHSQLELAQELDADGVHFPYMLWEKYKKEQKEVLEAWQKNKLIGLSIHGEVEAKMADGCVDYMFLSPVFHPSCKPVEGKGVSWFKKVQGEVKTPLVALGGITAENVQVLYTSGINHVAVMSYLMDMGNKVKNLRIRENNYE